MALDEALLEGVRQGDPPFLRFYRWSPGTLSLGRFQNPRTGLGPGSLSVPRVRRLTGGGAIWHDDELTYSLGCRASDLGSGGTGVKATFELLTGFLIDAWQAWGWPAHWAKDTDRRALGVFEPSCFTGTEEYDIVIAGRKLGGNAQRRDRGLIFQHGSLPRTLDPQRWATLFEPGREPPASGVTSLAQLGWTGPWSTLEAHLAASWEARLGVRLVPSEVEPAVAQEAQRLVTQRYANPSWTEGAEGGLRA